VWRILGGIAALAEAKPEDTNLAAMYQATVYPIYVVIDRDGNIAGTQRGAGGEEPLRRLLARGGLKSKDEDGDSGARR
jgi:hypothetical protein